MKMFRIATVVFLISCFSGIVRCGSSFQVFEAYVNQSCAEYETACAFGCCPYATATCCADGFECCQHGQTCIPIIGICIGAVNNNGQVSLTSTKSTPIRSSVLKCPSFTTECAPDKCCPYKDGDCCMDLEYCCPRGYKCDLSGSKCVRHSTNEIARNFYSVVAHERPLRKMSGKSPYKSCAGGRRMCPNYMSCCVNDSGEWGCCPNPSIPEIQYGGGQCCDGIFGHICCPNYLPFCTILGCL